MSANRVQATGEIRGGSGQGSKGPADKMERTLYDTMIGAAEH
jgi:hypothetical protein